MLNTAQTNESHAAVIITIIQFFRHLSLEKHCTLEKHRTLEKQIQSETYKQETIEIKTVQVKWTMDYGEITRGTQI